jgi:hypothetical protein
MLVSMFGVTINHNFRGDRHTFSYHVTRHKIVFKFQIIIGMDIKWPNGLTLDLIEKRVYWVDAKLNIIGSCSYDGSNRRTILHSLDSLKHPFSITMFEDYIYWTDWDKETIFKANKFNGKELESIISLKSLHHPMVVHVYHPYKQPDGINECQVINGHCSHLCLPAPKINSRSPLLSCACPDELILLSDGLTCAQNGKTLFPRGLNNYLVL